MTARGGTQDPDGPAAAHPEDQQGSRQPARKTRPAGGDALNEPCPAGRGHAATGITEPEAYALASMAVSFRVTQYAHQTASAYSSAPPKAVHAVITKDIFPADIRERVDQWLRPGTAAP